MTDAFYRLRFANLGFGDPPFDVDGALSEPAVKTPGARPTCQSLLRFEHWRLFTLGRTHVIKSAALRVTTDLRAAIRGIRFTVERSTPSRDLPRVLGTRARILSTRGIPRSCVTDVITRIEAWHLHITASAVCTGA